ncbi:MAG TPA: MFS transporter [Streptosporangiaceae bacterium]|jgi:putative MFS transporter
MSTADAVDGGSARESRIKEQPRLTLERVGARMDRLPLSRWHVILLLCVGAILVFQYMDNYAFSYASPGAIAELHLTVGQVGDINTYFGVGGLVGAIVAGLVVDRLGRRRTLIFFTGWYSLFCIANALVGTPLQFMLARTLSGFGATGASVAALSIIGEMVPSSYRGRLITTMTMVGGLGPAILSWSALGIVPASAGAWRALFLICALGFIALIVTLVWLPESPRWYVTRGRYEDAEKILSKIEAAVERTTRRPLPPVVEPPATPAESAAVSAVEAQKRLWLGVGDIFAQGYGKRWILVALMTACVGVAYFGFGFYLPTLLYLRGDSAAGSIYFAAIIFTCGNALAFGFWLVSDRWQRKYLLAGTGIAIAALALIYGTSSKGASAQLIIAGILIIAFLQVQVAFFYSFEAELFPTHIRGTALGTVAVVSGLIGLYGPKAITNIYGSSGFLAVFIFLMAVEIVLAVLVLVMGERTTKVSLEELNELGHTKLKGAA